MVGVINNRLSKRPKYQVHVPQSSCTNNEKHQVKACGCYHLQMWQCFINRCQTKYKFVVLKATPRLTLRAGDADTIF